MEKIVGIKFKNGCKVYYFAPGKDTYQKGMDVIVETARGLEFATPPTWRTPPNLPG